MMKDDRWKENKLAEYPMKSTFPNEVNLKKIILTSWPSSFHFETERRRTTLRKTSNRLGNNLHTGAGVFSKTVLHRYWELKAAT